MTASLPRFLEPSVQRLVFGLVAGGAILASLLLPRIPLTVELAVAATLIVVLGVPHGALDTLYARRGLPDMTAVRLAALFAGYVAVAALVVGVWLLSPLAFLVLFLGASAFHFSGDPEADAPLAVRVVYGLGIVVLPALLHRGELLRLYGLLTNETAARVVADGSVPLAYGVLALGIGSVLVVAARGRRTEAVELALVLALGAIAPPLLAFTVYFCLVHSARHIRRSAELMPQPASRLALECLLPMGAVVLMGGIAWRLGTGLMLDARVVRIVFVTLAALTAPHMVLIEPIRMRGWRLRPTDEPSEASTAPRRA